MISVGIIANPSAGKDIRRLVAQGRVVSDQEKSNTLLRVYAGLRSMGVERVFAMPESSGLTYAAAREFEGDIKTEYVQMPPAEHGGATARAAAAIVEDGVGCIVTLGGDGTNRNVATAGGEIPMVAISTGTNNVFPQMVEGTLAGIAAGAVASGKVTREESSRRSKRLEIFIDGELEDIALVDAAVSKELFAGTRAVWDLGTLTDVFLTRAEPACIGISALGAHLKRVRLDDPEGMHIVLGDDRSERKVLAPTGPGTVHEVGITEWTTMDPDDRITIELKPGMLALDGEREISLLPGKHIEIGLSVEGPWVVDVPRALEALAARNVAMTNRS
ncbi:MAG: NAD(+)/NADH kinase [Chloroflexi bacterium]|nr:NAD(+)/NADH kinase [Chloroflexota bacterium]